MASSAPCVYLYAGPGIGLGIWRTGGWRVVGRKRFGRKGLRITRRPVREHHPPLLLSGAVAEKKKGCAGLDALTQRRGVAEGLSAGSMYPFFMVGVVFYVFAPSPPLLCHLHYMGAGG